MTIDDLLKGLQRPKNEGKTLNGSKRDIWERIGRSDRFLELGLTQIESCLEKLTKQMGQSFFRTVHRFFISFFYALHILSGKPVVHVALMIEVQRGNFFQTVKFYKAQTFFMPTFFLFCRQGEFILIFFKSLFYFLIC